MAVLHLSQQAALTKRSPGGQGQLSVVGRVLPGPCPAFGIGRNAGPLPTQLLTPEETLGQAGGGAGELPNRRVQSLLEIFPVPGLGREHQWSPGPLSQFGV